MAFLAEVKSGFRLALMAVAGIGVLIISVFGLQRIGPGAKQNVPVGIAVILAVSLVLWVTRAFWSKWVFGFCFANVLRLAVMGVIGQTFTGMHASRIVFWELAAIFAILAFLTYRFTESQPTWWESVCLVVAVLSFFNSLIRTAGVEWMLIPPLILGGASAYRYLTAHTGPRAT
jgi:hypothetical protein